MRDVTRRIRELSGERAFAGERTVGHSKRLSGRFMEGLDTTFVAVTFAEAGEFEVARNIMGGGPGDQGGRIGSCLSGFSTDAA